MLLDGVLSGYLLFPAEGDPEPLVHPRDARTGLTYGILPWVHAVAGDVLDPAASQRHLALIEEHLLGPDGARLFDRPVAYRGGPMSVFQRAEASTFWGREIGLMYVHAHLRYAEALARVGDGAGLLRALALASPWGLEQRVPQSRPRQRSCYYSSSDGAFTDRDDASARYPDLMAGDVPLEGGWRIYSSGPGLALRLVVERLLGVRRRGDLRRGRPGAPHRLRRPPRRGAGRRAGSCRCGTPSAPRASASAACGSATASSTSRHLTNPHRRPGVSVRVDDLTAALDARHRPDRGDLLMDTPARPWLDAALDVERRVDALLAEMTLDEKVGQTHQVANIDPGTDADDLRAGRIGSSLYASGATAGNERDAGVPAGVIDEIQDLAVGGSRLGIPVLFGRDVIHGHRTVAPIPLGLAASFDPDLVRDGATTAAAEAVVDGIAWTFAPMVDLSEEPRWGRVAESFGEAPVLAGRLAVAAVAGFQGPDPSAPDRIGACAKHFVGYGLSAGGRDYDTVSVGENTLRNLHLRPFRDAVDARRAERDGVVQRRRRHPDARAPPAAARRAQGRVGLRRRRRRRLERRRPDRAPGGGRRPPRGDPAGHRGRRRPGHGQRRLPRPPRRPGP